MVLAELVPEAPEIERNAELVRRASDDGAYSRFWTVIRQMIPALRSAADRAEGRWFELTDSGQDELIRIKEALDKILQLPQPPAPLLARVKELLSDEERRVSWIFAGAVVRFHAIVEHALKEQFRLQQAMLEKMNSDPEMVAEIARGEAEFQSKLGTRFTAEEFKKRFSLT